MIRFAYSNLHCDAPSISKDWEILLKLVADFSIVLDNRVLYSECEFCVIEFAASLSRWLAEAPNSGAAFSYESLESDVKGLVWIKQRDDLWKVGSVHQDHDLESTFSFNQVQSAAREFFITLQREMLARFRIDISEFMAP